MTPAAADFLIMLHCMVTLHSLTGLEWQNLCGTTYMTNPMWYTLQLLKSRLILVGIANSLDLTERLLPGLEARGCKPRLVAFPTYTRTQISTVLQERLQSLPGPVFAAKALEFCSRKVGAARCSTVAPQYKPCVLNQHLLTV